MTHQKNKNYISTLITLILRGCLLLNNIKTLVDRLRCLTTCSDTYNINKELEVDIF